MKKFIKKAPKINQKYLTDRHGMPVFSETREMSTMASRDIEIVENKKITIKP